jgi:transcriptional regulator with XRE-family HTH domain
MSQIKKLREKMLVTQKELAEILHVSRVSIASYECGLTIPSFKIMRKLIELGEKNGVKIDANQFFKER